MPKILKKLGPRRVSIVLILLFFLVNSVWVKLDQTAPIIGDDARFLQGTYELYLPLKQGDFQEFYRTWQNLYVENTSSFPRTPLFALLSVPTFLVLGVSEDSAVITNLVVLALASFVLMLLCEQLLLKKEKSAGASNWLLPLSVVLFNVLPGVSGFGRLYMSETLQTFFVLLLTLLMFRYRSSTELRNFAKLGLLWSLALLLRFIMPVYLVIPMVVFVYDQLKLKQNTAYYLKALAVFFIAFLPLILTWYGQNLQTYLQFASYTTSGELAKYTSLGPVWHPLTVLRFWYVIATWVFGWPFVLLALAALLIRLLQQKFKYFRQLSKKQVLLLMIPFPALLAATLSDNKTARYFVPVIGFWVLLIAYEINLVFSLLRKDGLIRLPNVLSRVSGNRVLGKAAVVTLVLVFLISLCLSIYPYSQSVLTFLPKLPKTGLNYAAGPLNRSQVSRLRYQFFFQTYKQILMQKDLAKDNSTLKTYLVPEQTYFNEAELVWYFTERGYGLNSLGEFTKYEDLQKGKEKINLADILIVETNPETQPLYYDKYQEIVAYTLESQKFLLVSSLDIQKTQSRLMVFIKID